MPKVDKVKGGIVDGVGPLAPASAQNEGQGGKIAKNSKGKIREVVNLWRDPSAQPIVGAGHGDVWAETSAYWNRVQMDVVRILSERMGKRRSASQELPF